jgi:hypothetical protein
VSGRERAVKGARELLEMAQSVFAHAFVKFANPLPPAMSTSGSVNPPKMTRGDALEKQLYFLNLPFTSIKGLYIRLRVNTIRGLSVPCFVGSASPSLLGSVIPRNKCKDKSPRTQKRRSSPLNWRSAIAPVRTAHLGCCPSGRDSRTTKKS